jgi:hypothetical protein
MNNRPEVFRKDFRTAGNFRKRRGQAYILRKTLSPAADNDIIKNIIFYLTLSEYFLYFPHGIFRIFRKI